MNKILAMILMAAQTHSVPEPLLRAVCQLEGGRLVPGREGLCGVRNRHTPGYRPFEVQPDEAAHALRRWYNRCGSWAGALSFFHYGDCAPRPCPNHRHGGVYATEVLRAAGL